QICILFFADFSLCGQVLIYRALCISYVADMSDDFLVLKKWIAKNQSPEEIQSYMKLALENKFILERAENKDCKFKVEELRDLFL
ncbi:MAG: hypothetical protein NC253_13395, partial [Ruminococcus sp.]|nr:hypothetical protein [Ruminococcus sp.]